MTEGLIVFSLYETLGLLLVWSVICGLVGYVVALFTEKL